ncbi:signal peptidase I [Cryobacterium melibiosiphilum]
MRQSTVAGFVGNALLNLAALGGLVCLVLVVIAFAFNMTLIMFKTGSMSPTIPAGSVALVQEKPASEVLVGDVVTVDRAAALPITHRVTSVSPGRGGDERVITMRGDANATDDPVPYTVTTVRAVLGSVPGLAYVVVWMSNPLVLGAIALGASALVTWAFWPRAARRGGPGGEAGAETAAQARAAGAVKAAGAEPLPRVAAERLWCAGLLLAGVMIGGLAGPVAGATAVTPSPRPIPEEQTIRGNQLMMTMIGNAAEMADLDPGDVVQWEVGVDVGSDEPGSVRIALSGDGTLGLGLEAQISSCEQRWVDGTCPTGATVVQSAHRVRLDGRERTILTMPATEQRWLLFDVWRGTEGVDLSDIGTVQLHVHASGAGGDLTATPGRLGSIATTGVDPRLPALVAGGAILLGLLVAGGAALLRRRQP